MLETLLFDKLFSDCRYVLVDIQSATAEIRRGEKKKERRKKETQKYNVRICYTQGGHN